MSKATPLVSIPRRAVPASGQSARLRLERERRMVRDDPQLAVPALEEDPCLVDLGDGAGLVGQKNIPRCDGDVSLPEDGTVDDLHLAPALQRKSTVVGVGTIATDKVGQRALT